MAEGRMKKSLGQIVYEASARVSGQLLGIPDFQVPGWEHMLPAPRQAYEDIGQAVKAAVLAEHAVPLWAPLGYEAAVLAEQEQDVKNAIYHPVRIALAASRDLSAESQNIISAAIEQGVLAGLKAWEARR